MIPISMLIIRVAQGVFALVGLGLSAFVTNWYMTTTTVSSPSQINFLIFSSIWSFLSLACIVVLPRLLPRVPRHYISAAFDATNVLFWFAGAIALGVFLERLFFCRGDVCRAAQADVAFAVFSFVLWSASALLTGWDVLRARRRGGSSGGGGGGNVGGGAVPMPVVKEGMAQA
ncbi:ad09652d-4cbd-459c-aa10-f0f23cd27e33 [Thermothielavioides terrestris]|uniref:Ad09652d-4cbd-459c-aa10-f0f23cd27e33 n=1 Tax=Thermothielavioides terrestris TaxID=2587410 RepID=A0A446BXS9_9PEZI|nr:ad09652d-4cbd-459c-aa10-f0f23cd27e33 [Thermothielavioides terrestris]